MGIGDSDFDYMDETDGMGYDDSQYTTTNNGEDDEEDDDTDAP